MAKVIIIGPGHPLRGGGLTTFNHRLAKELIEQGHDCQIYSFSLQYPSFLFPGKTQYSDEAAPEGIIIKSVINSINPFNWLKIGNWLKKERADIIIVRYWLPFMGPSLGTILRKVRKNRHTKIICLADNVIPHEKRMGDKPFTKYFLKSCDAFITMSEKVMSDLRLFQKTLPTGRQAKPAILVPHPLYDNFGAILSKQEAREKLKIKNDALILLFFGFIRKYKGLDILFEAMADERIKKAGIRLLVAGEFYEDERKYKDQIDTLGIREQLILRTDFIPDNDVKYYLCAADAVVQPYRNATQSGVSPLAYHFEKPMIVTNVGGLPALVPDGKAGLVTAPTPEAIADAILKFYQLGENYFIPH
ncbi:MAG: glycosyltransferase, partial [Chitinophagaceae bacterium]